MWVLFSACDVYIILDCNGVSQDGLYDSSGNALPPCNAPYTLYQDNGSQYPPVNGTNYPKIVAASCNGVAPIQPPYTCVNPPIQQCTQPPNTSALVLDSTFSLYALAQIRSSSVVSFPLPANFWTKSKRLS